MEENQLFEKSTRSNEFSLNLHNNINPLKVIHKIILFRFQKVCKHVEMTWLLV